MEVLIVILEMLRRLLPRIGPYLLVELVLPGGSLLALLLYLYRRRNSSSRPDSALQPQRTAMVSAQAVKPDPGIGANGRSAPVEEWKVRNRRCCAVSL
jgi:hypothetical protein